MRISYSFLLGFFLSIANKLKPCQKSPQESSPRSYCCKIQSYYLIQISVVSISKPVLKHIKYLSYSKLLSLILKVFLVEVKILPHFQEHYHHNTGAGF